jgi:hypothetical protein
MITSDHQRVSDKVTDLALQDTRVTPEGVNRQLLQGIERLEKISAAIDYLEEIPEGSSKSRADLIRFSHSNQKRDGFPTAEYPTLSPLENTPTHQNGELELAKASGTLGGRACELQIVLHDDIPRIRLVTADPQTHIDAETPETIHELLEFLQNDGEPEQLSPFEKRMVTSIGTFTPSVLQQLQRNSQKLVRASKEFLKLFAAQFPE